MHKFPVNEGIVTIPEHRLNIREGYSLVRQKKVGQAPEHAKAIQTETLQRLSRYRWTESLMKREKGFTTSHRVSVLQLPSPRTIKEVQSLNGKLASLNRFLSKSAENSLPLFKTLKKCIKKSEFHWTPDMEQAFKQLKQHLLELPLLVVPKPKGELIVYLSASHGAISAILMNERGMVLTPTYFVSRALQGPKLNYTLMENLVLSLVFAAKRLRRYFQAHPIAILADFLVEKPDESPPDTSVVETLQEGTEFTYALRFQFVASNNEAEYEALIDGLRIAAQIGVLNEHVSVESKLVANQVLGAYVAKEENMIKYLEKVKSLVSGFANFSISQVPQNKNKKADALSKIASTNFAHLSKQVLVEILKENSVKEKEVTTVVEEDGLTWMTPIIEYLKEGTLPVDKKEASKLRIKAMAMWGINIVGPFPVGLGKVKFLIVAMDYFIKWIEAKALSTITGNQSNRLVERANRSMGDGIKARLGEGNKNWIEELPHVLWAYCTMIKSSHDDTPFSLTYGYKAVIPAEIGMPKYHTTTVDAIHNDEVLRLNLDLLEERRERAAICEAKAKLQMTKYYNARVRGVTFRPEDFVYRSNDASHDVAGGKLGPKWEGPYEVTEALEDGAYRLRSMDGTILLRT
ncbi:reverse transcriptase domain-containing protein [Tanacetum coccineum]